MMPLEWQGVPDNIASEWRRSREFDALRQLLRRSKAVLVFGEAGVGKTHLLQLLCCSSIETLYTDRTNGARDLLMSLWDNMKAKRMTNKRIDTATSSVVSLKGVVQSVLSSHPCTLVLDGIDKPSRVLTRLIRDLHFLGRTPVVLCGRSTHMEDIGDLHALCPGKSERLEVRKWSREAALLFAQRRAEQSGLTAHDLPAVINAIVSYAVGNPRAIITMLNMAAKTEYRSGGEVKMHVLYVDFCMGQSQNQNLRSA